MSGEPNNAAKSAAGGIRRDHAPSGPQKTAFWGRYLAVVAVDHIPPLDACLLEWYGPKFDACAQRTKRLIPLIW